jgi:hypothetical protein
VLNEEDIIEELKQLFDEQFGVYLEAVNKRHNDSIKLVPFYGSTVDGTHPRPPYLKFAVTEGEYSEKDRIIGYGVCTVTVEPVLPSPFAGWKYLARYREAVREMIKANSGGTAWEYCSVTGWKDSVITLRVEG